MPSHRVVLDEHIAKSVGRRLESYGLDAVHIADLDMIGSSDEEIIDYAERTERVIVTRDDDFKQLVSQESGTGVLFLTKRLPKRETASEIMKVFNSMSMEDLEGEVVFIPW